MDHIVKLQDAFKGYTLDQDKLYTPDETVQRFKEKLKHFDLDILERAVRIDNGRLDIPVFISICGKDALDIIGTKKQMGKGATLIQSEASALMELAERFSFFSFVKNPQNFFQAEYRHLQEPVLSYDLIMKSVHDTSDDAQKIRPVFERLPLHWTWAYNLTQQQEVLIPFDWFYTINEFNGPSAGNCVEEALLQGICEIMERHVCALVSRNRLKTRAIDTGSIQDPVVLEMLHKYEKNGIKLYLNDISLDTGIPTIGALAYDPATFPAKSEIVWTAGTTPNPLKALSRALTEVAQLAGDFNTSANYLASGLPKFTNLAEADFITQNRQMIDLDRLPDLSNNNMRIEVENCLAALAKNNMDVLVVNTLHARLKVPAFYTIIPGAHFRERAKAVSMAMFCARMITTNLKPRAALQELVVMETLLPDKYFLKFNQGLCYLNLKKPDQALEYFKQALASAPNQEDIATLYSYMGQALKEKELYREALETLKQGEQHDRDRTDIYNLMGFCYYKLREYQKAIECFRQVLRLNPSSAIDYANIASNYREMGEKQKAIEHYHLALTLDSSLDFARENLLKLEGGK